MRSSKAEKEAFVSNLTGSNSLQVLKLSFVFFTSYLIWKLVLIKITRRTFYALEYLLILLPLVFSCTIFADYIDQFLLSQLCVGLVLYNLPQPSKPIQSSPSPRHEAFINAARCFLQLSTCVAILAVDFRIFPRRLAKTESFGVSWMDAGKCG